ncbi:MAG TPA: hypothetical protein VM690_08395, partial [Gaiellaceae bacterium]|nr:hypothetical protein [Gaiellaceae bacterium]
MGFVALAAAVAVVAAGCGSSKKATSTSSAGGTKSGKSFPLFKIATDTGTDYLDPGLSYTV